MDIQIVTIRKRNRKQQTETRNWRTYMHQAEFSDGDEGEGQVLNLRETLRY